MAIIKLGLSWYNRKAAGSQMEISINPLPFPKIGAGDPGGVSVPSPWRAACIAPGVSKGPDAKTALSVRLFP